MYKQEIVDVLKRKGIYRTLCMHIHESSHVSHEYA
jgi:hypothetical protein